MTAPLQEYNVFRFDTGDIVTRYYEQVDLGLPATLETRFGPLQLAIGGDGINIQTGDLTNYLFVRPGLRASDWAEHPDLLGATDKGHIVEALGDNIVFGNGHSLWSSQINGAKDSQFVIPAMPDLESERELFLLVNDGVNGKAIDKLFRLGVVGAAANDLGDRIAFDNTEPSAIAIDKPQPYLAECVAVDEYPLVLASGSGSQTFRTSRDEVLADAPVKIFGGTRLSFELFDELLEAVIARRKTDPFLYKRVLKDHVDTLPLGRLTGLLDLQPQSYGPFLDLVKGNLLEVVDEDLDLDYESLSPEVQARLDELCATVQREEPDLYWAWLTDPQMAINVQDFLRSSNVRGNVITPELFLTPRELTIGDDLLTSDVFDDAETERDFADGEGEEIYWAQIPEPNDELESVEQIEGSDDLIISGSMSVAVDSTDEGIHFGKKSPGEPQYDYCPEMLRSLASWIRRLPTPGQMAKRPKLDPCFHRSAQKGGGEQPQSSNPTDKLDQDLRPYLLARKNGTMPQYIQKQQTRWDDYHPSIHPL